MLYVHYLDCSDGFHKSKHVKINQSVYFMYSLLYVNNPVKAIKNLMAKWWYKRLIYVSLNVLLRINH
jgi:hypothetical protein